MSDPASIIAELQTTLERESIDLKRGDLSRLDIYNREKTEALARLETALASETFPESGWHRDKVKRVNTLADENAVLLRAAHRGVSRVMESLSGASEDRDVGVFDSLGKARTFSSSNGILQKKF